MDGIHSASEYPSANTTSKIGNEKCTCLNKSSGEWKGKQQDVVSDHKKEVWHKRYLEKLTNNFMNEIYIYVAHRIEGFDGIQTNTKIEPKLLTHWLGIKFMTIG